MLIWTCALHCEAKPVIDFYRLKKLKNPNHFDCYQNDQMLCVVSGMGGQNMQQAVNWVIETFKIESGSGWINIGIAGHLSYPVGTALLVSSVSQHDRSTAIFLHPPEHNTLASCALSSQQKENTDYQANVIFDLEAYAFVNSVKAFSPLHHCQCVKVISDNADTPPQRNKAAISQLIADTMPAIHEVAMSLQKRCEAPNLEH